MLANFVVRHLEHCVGATVQELRENTSSVVINEVTLLILPLSEANADFILASHAVVKTDSYR